MTFVLILYFDWLQGPHIGQNFEKNIKKSSQKLSRGLSLYFAYVPDSGLYIICVFLFQADKNSGCYGNLKFP